MESAVLALVVLALVVLAVVRQVDVRLALALGALPLFVAAGRLPQFLGVFAREMANPATIVPICSAMGFSHVLRRTGCDLHLVHLLLGPVRRVRPLLLPGGVAAGYLVNTTIVSQTAAAAVLGSVLIPLLRLSGVDAVTAGATLLLGCSMGGELFNPGAVEVRTLAEQTGTTAREVIAVVTPFNLLATGTALLGFWALAARRGRDAGQGEGGAIEVPELPRVHPIKAAVPVLPIVLLFTVPALARLPEKEFPRLSEPASVLAAMLIGVAAATLTTPGKVRDVAGSFFEGAGYAYTHVISLIVTTTLFTEGVRVTGLIDLVTSGLAGRPAAAVGVGVVVPWALATVGGSGIAPAVAVIKVLVPAAARLGLDPARLGALIAMAAHFGRTMSPAAAVVGMSATLSGARKLDLVRRVAPALFLGGVALLALALARLVAA